MSPGEPAWCSGNPESTWGSLILCLVQVRSMFSSYLSRDSGCWRLNASEVVCGANFPGPAVTLPWEQQWELLICSENWWPFFSYTLSSIWTFRMVFIASWDILDTSMGQVSDWSNRRARAHPARAPAQCTGRVGTGTLNRAKVLCFHWEYCRIRNKKTKQNSRLW